MYFKSKGIFLRQTKYSDTSAVVKIYTEEFGIQSYMVKGLHSKKSKIRPSLFYPLSIFDMVVSHKESSELQHIKEIQVTAPFISIPHNILKSSVVIFLSELLYKSLKEEQTNKALFSFLEESIRWIDEMQELPPDFHLLFAVKLSKYLGFAPQGAYQKGTTVFDLQEGFFRPELLLEGSNVITGMECEYFSRLLQSDFTELSSWKMPSSVRQNLLEKLLLYYSFHIPTATNFKSHRVLHDVLR